MREEEEILANLVVSVEGARDANRRAGDSSLMEEVKTLKKQASQRRAEAPSRVTADDLLAGAVAIGGATVVDRMQSRT